MKISSPTLVPIGSRFQENGRFYRVTGWVREVPYKLHATNTGDLGMDIISEILNEEYVQQGKLGKFYQEWCLPEEATHVSGVGVCGGIFKISEVTWEGTICDVPAKFLEMDRESAIKRAGKRVG